MKPLKIVYDGAVLFDGEVAEFTWVDSANGVRVEGKSRTGGAANLLEALAGAAKSKTADVAAEKRAAFDRERASAQ